MTKVKFAAGDELTATKLNTLNSGSYNAGETINGATLPVAVYQNTSDNEFYACDGNDTAKLNFVGFAISNSTDGNPMTIQFDGIVEGFSGLVEGELYYVQDDKTIGTAKGTATILVGRAISETEILIIKDSHEIIVKSGVITRSFGGDSGAVNTAHGLGRIPKRIKLTAFYAPGSAVQSAAQSVSTYDGTNTFTIYIENDTNGGVIKNGTDTTNAVVIISGSNATVSQKGIVTFDATNITLTWTKAGSGSGSIYILWEVEA